MIEIGTLIIASSLWALLSKIFAKNPELKKITNSKTYKDYLRKHFKKTHIGALKSQITISINTIIDNHSRFKIGKTGNPDIRNIQHTDYKKMFLLCESKDESFISELETYYNSKYIEHGKNDNKRKGSAGKSIAANGKFFLYVIVK
jgi:hypothetical protein